MPSRKVQLQLPVPLCSSGDSRRWSLNASARCQNFTGWLEEVDVVGSPLAIGRHSLDEEHAILFGIFLPVDISDCLDGLNKRGPRHMDRAHRDKDVDDRFCGQARDRGAAGMLDGENLVRPGMTRRAGAVPLRTTGANPGRSRRSRSRLPWPQSVGRSSVRDDHTRCTFYLCWVSTSLDPIYHLFPRREDPEHAELQGTGRGRKRFIPQSSAA